MSKVKSYLSLIKFSHTIFAMPFALIGFFLGIAAITVTIGGTSVVPGWHLPVLSAQQSDYVSSHNIPIETGDVVIRFFLVIDCMVFARSAAMAFNRYLDRSFDERNPRTAIREIPGGIIKANSVLLFTIISCLLFIGSTFFINKICF